MNSLQKQGSPALLSPVDFVKAFEAKLAEEKTVEAVDVLLKKLQFLGLHFDPFVPEASSECRQILDHLDLTHHVSNPYLATNLLLQLLDKAEERLNSLKQ